MSCEHEEFESSTEVCRLTDEEGGPATGFTLDLRIRCTQCNTPFHFKGLPRGMDLNGAARSIDGLEARLTIGPGEDMPDIPGARLKVVN